MSVGSASLGCPSLQSDRSYLYAASAVAVMDDLALRMKYGLAALDQLAEQVAELPVKRRGALARARLLADLRGEAERTRDMLAEHGFLVHVARHESVQAGPTAALRHR